MTLVGWRLFVSPPRLCMSGLPLVLQSILSFYTLLSDIVCKSEATENICLPSSIVAWYS